MRYLPMNFNMLFVFDGPGRPKLKRNTGVGVKKHHLTDTLCDLIQHCGFHVHFVRLSNIRSNRLLRSS